jgi:hypothetical protein
VRSGRKKRALAVKVVEAASDLDQHQQPGICDPGQSFENHAWERCSHNFHRFIIVLAHYRLRPYRIVLALPACFVGLCTMSVSGPPFADGAILVCALRLEEVLDQF